MHVKIADMSPQNQKPEQPSDNTQLKTDIVSNIPLHQAAGPAPIHEAEDIDGIMKDVTHQLKKEDVKPAKHHLFGHKADAPAAHPAGQHSSPAAPQSPSPAAQAWRASGTAGQSQKPGAYHGGHIHTYNYRLFNRRRLGRLQEIAI
jgi:hypothetical protein